jgi:hypothetical protein
MALGGHSAELYYALAQTSFRAGPEHIDAAQSAIEQALKLAPDDVQAKTLGARIAATKSAATRSTSPESRDEMVDPAKLFLAKPPQDW